MLTLTQETNTHKSLAILFETNLPPCHDVVIESSTTTVTNFSDGPHFLRLGSQDFDHIDNGNTKSCQLTFYP